MLLNEANNRFIISINAGHYSTVTIEYNKRYLIRLSKFLWDPEINTITTDHIRQFFTGLRTSGLSGYSVQVYWKVIRSFDIWAIIELCISCRDLFIPGRYCDLRPGNNLLAGTYSLWFNRGSFSALLPYLTHPSAMELYNIFSQKKAPLDY